MNNKNYIKIPTIKSLRVVNYPLFYYHHQDHWAFQVKDGINLMLGANSIGKTTTMNMIIFAFVGNQKEINVGYFSERLTPAQQRTKNQAIVLEFTLNGQVIEIHRNLQSGELEQFKINNLAKSTLEYPNFLTENTKISSSKWIDLLDLMLIRVEEGNYILWDKEAQTRILSALLNDVEFQEAFLQDEANHLIFEEHCSKLYYRLKDKRNQESELMKKIENEKNKQKQTKSIETLLKDLENYKAQKTTLIKEIEELQKRLNAEKEQLKAAYETYEAIRVTFRLMEVQIESAEIEIKTLKAKIVNAVVETNCILCKTVLSEEKAIQIHQQYHIDKICPVCESSLGESLLQEDPQLIKSKLRSKQTELSHLKEQFLKVKFEYETATNQKNTHERNVDTFRYSIVTNERNRHDLNLKILDLENTIDLFNQKNANQPTNYDEVLLLRIRQEIIDITTQFQLAEKEKNESAVKISKQRGERNKIIFGFYEKLNIIFKKYSQEYFAENCELTFFPPTNKGITQLHNFAPKFKEIKRLHRKSVSHSEAVFLEYLFRVSLLELYFGEAGVKPFLFLETSEGVFDVANTESAAKLFSKFAADKFPVIIVSNLSKKTEFIDLLFNTQQEKEERLFNLIHFGNLTARQHQNKQLEFYFKNSSKNE